MEQTTNNQLPALIEVRDQLPALLEKNMPWLEQKQQQGIELLDSISPPTNDEELEDIIAKLSGVSKLFTAMQERRKEMTRITDAFSNALMEFERPFDTKSGAKSKYQEKRKYVDQYNQRKLEEQQRKQAEVAKRKELENLKVDLKAKILQALSQNVIDTVKRADEYARNFFATLDSNNFDAQSEQFKKQKPKLKQETYDKCFEVSWNSQLMSKEEYVDFCSSVKEEETYEKWNSAVQEAVAPIMNEWRARIPDLKSECIRKAQAGDEERKKIEEERKKRDEEEQRNRQEQLDKAKKEQEDRIQEEASTNKTMNELTAQASMWGAESGPTKYVLKFTDPAEIPKAFASIIFHCLKSPEFPGFQKRDKNKKLMIDDKNRPVYIDAVQWWIDFFLKNCNAEIPNTKVFQDAKTIVR